MKITIDKPQLQAKIEGAWKEQLPALSAQVLQDCNQYVKVDQHGLENSSYIHSDLKNGKLVWDTPYAKRQYWEIRTSLTPGRTWKWCETAARKHKQDWAKIAEKGLKQNL